MPCNVCTKVLEKGRNPVEFLWSEPTHFMSLFGFNWPQRERTHQRLFDRPRQNTRIDVDGQNQIRYISGAFRLTKEFIESNNNSDELKLYSNGVAIGNVRIQGDVAHVSTFDNPPLWHQGTNRAHYVSFSGGIAEINWVE